MLIDDEPELGACMVDTRERDAAAAGTTVLIGWRLASAHDTSRNLAPKRAQPLTGSPSASMLRAIMQAWDAGRTGFFGYYFSYRPPGGPMP
jgi:hypothetical protein